MFFNKILFLLYYQIIKKKFFILKQKNGLSIMKNTETTKKIEQALDLMQNDTLKAIEIFDQILESEPENIEALNGKGSSLMKLNLMDDAEKYFDCSLSIKETSSALISKGIINKNKKNYEDSLSYYDKAILINPELNNIITLLKNEVIELIDEDVEIEFDNLNPETKEIIEKGLEYKNSNKLWDALDCYENAIKSDETCINYVQKLIKEIKTTLYHELMIKTPIGNSKIDQLKIQSLRLLLIEENPEQSLTVINQVLEKENEDIDSLNQKGCVLLFFDKFETAIECFDKCLEIDENYIYALFNKAITLRMTNKLKESLNCFDKLLKITDTPKIKSYQLEILDKLHNEN